LNECRQKRDSGAAGCRTQPPFPGDGCTSCVTTDQLPSYRKVVRRAYGRKVQWRINQYLNNRIEQDHRGVKQRHEPMLGLKCLVSAATFCSAYDETRQHFRTRRIMKETISLRQRREHLRQAVTDLRPIFLSCPIVAGRGANAITASYLPRGTSANAHAMSSRQF